MYRYYNSIYNTIILLIIDIIIPRRETWSLKQVEEKQTYLRQFLQKEGILVLHKEICWEYILGPGDFCYDTIITNPYTRNFIQRKQ